MYPPENPGRFSLMIRPIDGIPSRIRFGFRQKISNRKRPGSWEDYGRSKIRKAGMASENILLSFHV